MIIIVGGEPDVHGVTQHAKREGGIMHAHKDFLCASVVQNAVCTFCAYVVV